MTPAYQSKARLDQVTAILAAVGGGYRVEMRASQSQPSADAGSDIPRSPVSQHSDGGREP